MEEIRSIPCLTQLRHLTLAQKGSFKHLAGSIRHLPSLRTLSLEAEADDGYDPERRPHLDLAGLSQLHTVILSDILPASLTLPEGAALRLHMSSLECARQEIWSSVALALQSISIDCCDVIIEVSQLPRIFAEPSGLKNILLCLNSFGDKEHPIEFYGAFLQVEWLLLKTQNELCVRVPARSLHWQVVRLWGKMLDIDFANAGDFLVRCLAFSIAYHSQRGLGLMHLCHAIAQRGIKWGTQDHIQGRMPHAMHEIRTPCVAACFFLDPRRMRRAAP